MLSGRVDKASIDSETKLSIACVWPASKREEDMYKVKVTEKEKESISKGEVWPREQENNTGIYSKIAQS